METGAPVDHDRLSLLDRLCISPQARHILEVNAGGAPVLCGENWHGSAVTRLSASGVEAGENLPFAP